MIDLDTLPRKNHAKYGQKLDAITIRVTNQHILRMLKEIASVLPRSASHEDLIAAIVVSQYNHLKKAGKL